MMELISSVGFLIFSTSLFIFSLIVFIRALIFSSRLAKKTKRPVKKPWEPPTAKFTDIDMKAIINKHLLEDFDDFDLDESGRNC